MSQTELIRTKIKFKRSTKDNVTLVGYVTKNDKGVYMGCREDAPVKKKVVIPDSILANSIVENALYDCGLKSMKNGNGFIAVEIELCLFPAVVDTVVTSNRFKVTVKFGNKSIIYDPQYGQDDSRKTVEGALKALKERNDIRDKDQVIDAYLRSMIDRTQGIAVDAAHSTKNRMTEYRGIDLKTGQIIFHEKLGNQTVNIGEFLAIVEGVKHIYETGYTPKVIFSDSMVAITWFVNRKTASGKRNMELMKAEAFIRIMDEKIKDIKVIHWDNKAWGEIPADFGRK